MYCFWFNFQVRIMYQKTIWIIWKTHLIWEKKHCTFRSKCQWKWLCSQPTAPGFQIRTVATWKVQRKVMFWFVFYVLHSVHMHHYLWQSDAKVFCYSCIIFGLNPNPHSPTLKMALISGAKAPSLAISRCVKSVHKKLDREIDFNQEVMQWSVSANLSI